MSDTSETAAVPANQEFKRHENFESWYTNNIQFHPTEWDLKLIFGEIDWQGNSAIVQQHTAMSVAWLQVKLMQYFLNLQIGIYEMQHGTIKVPSSVLPPEPQPPSDEDLKKYPFAYQAYEYIKKAREQFISSLG